MEGLAHSAETGASRDVYAVRPGESSGGETSRRRNRPGGCEVAGRPPTDVDEAGRVYEPLDYQLHLLLALVRAPVESELRKLGLGLPQYACMRILSTSPPLTGAELARIATVSRQAMDRVLTELQTRGLVTRSADGVVGRGRPARLTAQGNGLLRRADDAVRVVDKHLTAGLSEPELQELTRLLSVVVRR